MQFPELVYEMVDNTLVLLAIAELLALKAQSHELDLAPRIPVLDRFIDDELARLRQVLPREEAPPESAALDRFFQSQCA